MSLLFNAGRQNLQPVDAAITSNKFTYGYTPLTKGNTAPDFTLQEKNAILNSSAGMPASGPISLKDFLLFRQPLVVLFYNALNNNIPDITRLISLNKDIQVMGGRLLILTGTAPRHFNKIQLQENTLPVYYDSGNEIAGQFGLYDSENPLWNWVSGIEDEALPLSAAYIIAPNGKIIFHHIDYTFDLFTNKVFEDAFIRSLLTNVFHNAQQHAGFGIEYKSVS
ncbi:redoxin domain-containing protein [Parafilimonas sp.]|uniref:redoxin domain-containing protein n=1 Tax=Parafilimonas sp. TaxID=1969739 RepID=UPI0039E5368A